MTRGSSPLLFVLQLGRLGQQQAGFDLGQPGRHQQIFGRELQIEPLHQLHVLHVLGGDLQDRQIEDIELLTPDKVEQQIERPLEGIEEHLQRIGRDEQVLGQLVVGLPQDFRDGRCDARAVIAGAGRHRICGITQTGSGLRHRDDALPGHRRRSPRPWWAARPDNHR